MNNAMTNGNGTKAGGGAPRHESFFLTELLDGRAVQRGRKLGRLQDIVAVDQDRVAEVTHIKIARPFGAAALLVPMSHVRLLQPGEVVLDLDNPENYIREPSADEVLLRDYLLDKKVLDVEEREVEVVYDMRLVATGDKIFVTDVDISRYGLLRRLGMKALAQHFYRRASETKKRLIPWSYIEPLPAGIGTLQGNLKLRVLKEKLTDIHPADLADILEELDSAQRVTLLEGLDTEHASDTLEEIDPAVQRDIVFSLRKERVAELIADMTPGQAADIVAVLPATEKRALLQLLDPAQVEKIGQILAHQDINILDFTTQKFLWLRPDATVAQARVKFRELGPDADVLDYFYIVGDGGKLLGVVDLAHLFMADDAILVNQLMIENLVSLTPHTTMKEADDIFRRYAFKALPVAGENDVMLGVVPARDVLQVKHRILE